MIGIFDSGSGGLTVLRALRERAPTADVLYFADLAHVPYGNKTRALLQALTRDAFALLLKEGADCFVSACNSVSNSVTEDLLEEIGIPKTKVLGMVGPAVAHLETKGANVLVVATRATVESGVYEKALEEKGVPVQSLALPDLVACIEAGDSHESMVAMLRRELVPHVRQHHTHIVLGCTHFPLAKDAFTSVLSKNGYGHAVLYDPAESVADCVVRQFDTTGTGSVRFIVSKHSDVFLDRARDIAPAYSVFSL